MSDRRVQSQPVPARVLAWVNRQRKAMGRKPITKMPRAKWYWGNGGRCSIATALGGRGVLVGLSQYFRPDSQAYVWFPAYMVEFNWDLWHGQYPHLLYRARRFR